MANKRVDLPRATSVVLEKLKRHPGYKDQDISEEILIQLAKKLSDPEEIKMDFSYLLDSFQRIISKTGKERELDLDLTSLETESMVRKEEESLTRAMQIPVKLILRKLRHRRPPLANRLSQLLRFEYGPFHSTLQIGEITIEWGNENLVIPSMVPLLPGVFQAQVSNQSEWCEKTRTYSEAIGQAEMQRNREEKFDVVFTSMSEKLQMIDRLIDVIVSYNCEKTYNVFTCNCQHFTRDCLSALGYKDTLQFTGKLSDYLQQLKSGKLTVPEEYSTHENLDMYITENLDGLTLPDMEYLLCQYFKYHLPSMESMGDRDLDDWTCTIATCQSEELDSRVRDKSSLQSLLDMDYMHPDLPEELKKVTLVDQERIMKTIKGGYQEKVLKKLKRHQDGILLKDKYIVDKLAEKEKFRDSFCTGIIEGVSETLVVEELADCGSKDTNQARANAIARMEVFCNFPVKFFLYCTKRGSSQLTPTLQVGRNCFEWSKFGLIVPQDASKIESKQPVLKIGVPQEGIWCFYVKELQPSISLALEQLNYSKLIELKYQLAQRKDELLGTFIDVVMKYNREYNYSLWKCNMQQFLVDAQLALGIDHPHTKVSKTFQEHFKRVKQMLKKIEKLKFESHRELDIYVEERIADFDQKSSEYYIAQYFAFHVSQWEKEELCETWSCDEPSCKLQRLEEEMKLYMW